MLDKEQELTEQSSIELILSNSFCRQGADSFS